MTNFNTGVTGSRANVTDLKASVQQTQADIAGIRHECVFSYWLWIYFT